jgi:hypothetical protein
LSQDALRGGRSRVAGLRRHRRQCALRPGRTRPARCRNRRCFETVGVRDEAVLRASLTVASLGAGRARIARRAASARAAKVLLRWLNPQSNPRGFPLEPNQSLVAHETLHVGIRLAIFELGPKKLGFHLCPWRVASLDVRYVACIDDPRRGCHPAGQLSELTRAFQLEIADLRLRPHLRPGQTSKISSSPSNETSSRHTSDGSRKNSSPTSAQNSAYRRLTSGSRRMVVFQRSVMAKVAEPLENEPELPPPCVSSV